MKRGRRQRRRRMYVTEVGAGSASGGNPLNRGEQGQANLLKDIYKYFLKKRQRASTSQSGQLVQLAGLRPRASATGARAPGC